MKQLVLLILVMLALIAATVWFASRAFVDVPVEMSWHGWLAMSLGIFFTAGLGGGLMWLVFYSARKGYDEVDHEL